MADGALREPPYTAVLGLVRWADQPGIWHELDGRAAAAGVNPGDLPADRFLNFIYAEMLQRVNVREGQTAEQARKRFDGQLGVRAWATPGTEARELEPRDPKAPWWWDNAEEASSSFLAAMGVNLV